MEKVKKNSLSVALFLIVVLLLQSCASRGVKVQPVSPRPQKRQLAMMGYTIQAGAFAQVQNAVRLTEKLKDKGLDATYFKASDGLFKVRFGNGFRVRIYLFKLLMENPDASE